MSFLSSCCSSLPGCLLCCLLLPVYVSFWEVELVFSVYSSFSSNACYLVLVSDGSVTAVFYWTIDSQSWFLMVCFLSLIHI